MLIVLGDFNIAPKNIDVHDPEKWQGSVLVSEAEREAFSELLACMLTDSFRLVDQSSQFCWWDYRRLAFKRNAGLRIDLILVSDVLVNDCVACEIDREARKHERPSDHAPVVLTLG
jgi:exodeoxyribonuclease III